MAATVSDDWRRWWECSACGALSMRDGDKSRQPVCLNCDAPSDIWLHDHFENPDQVADAIMVGVVLATGVGMLTLLWLLGLFPSVKEISE